MTKQERRPWFIVAKLEGGDEIIDEVETFSEARYLQHEYALAFRGVVIKILRNPSHWLKAQWYGA